ncbi:MAG TPA: cytochrome C [Desulfuromonadaceae bacterium]|jgi:hypothetical protein
MRSHVWRPLYLALFLLAVILLVRYAVVPEDFGIHERGYMYGWHRKSNEEVWKMVPVRYKTAAHCPECHPQQYNDLKNSPHRIISCENCHGPNYEHPKDPAGYNIDRTRKLCLRCHARLLYPNSDRVKITGINPVQHYSQAECVMCHIPHNPKPLKQKQKVQ